MLNRLKTEVNDAWLSLPFPIDSSQVIRIVIANQETCSAHYITEPRRSTGFEATITATSSPFLNKYAKLTVPIWFMREHGAKIQENVKLISRATGRTWTVEVIIYHPHKRPQVMFCRGWSAYASFNCLVEGDRLTFTLTAMSEFEVGISRMPFPSCIPRSKRVKSSQRETTASSGCTRDEYMPAAEERENLLFSISCAQPNAIEVAADCDRKYYENSSSFSKSHLLSPRIGRNSALERCQGEEPVPAVKHEEQVTSLSKGDRLRNLIEKKRSRDLEYKDSAPRKKLRKSLPNFFKKLTRSHCYVLEIPCIFAKTYGIQLDTFVTLRWLHPESPVYNVACAWRMDREKRRISLADGWKEFKTENGLQLGQELVFTLIADSSFVVRPRVPP